MKCPKCGEEIDEADLYELGEAIDVDRRPEKSGVVLAIRLDAMESDAFFGAAGDRSVIDCGLEALMQWAWNRTMNINDSFTTTTVIPVKLSLRRE